MSRCVNPFLPVEKEGEGSKARIKRTGKRKGRGRGNCVRIIDRDGAS